VIAFAAVADLEPPLDGVPDLAGGVGADLRSLAVDDGAAFVAACARVAAARTPGTVAAVRAALNRALDVNCRRAAVVAIIRLGEDALLRQVAHALLHDDPVVVVGAARVLADVGDIRAVPNLVEALRTDDRVVGAAIIDALGALGDPAALPWVMSAVEHGFCVEAGCAALGRLGDDRAIMLLQKLGASDDKAVALAASQALVRLEERGVSSW
jgi:HEAT repeat protein